MSVSVESSRLVPPSTERKISESSDSSTNAVLTSSDKEALATFAKTKKKIAIIVKRKRDFFRHLPDLTINRPTDIALVAFVPDESKPNIRPEVAKCFDWIIYYDDTDNYFYGAKSLDEIKLPNLHVFGDELVEVVPKDKILLIHSEETSMTEVARVRERHGLEGPKIADIDPIRRKDLVYQRARAAGIPIAKTVCIDFAHRRDKEAIIEEITETIGDFPMFAKRVMLTGGLGMAKIDNEEGLECWLDGQLKERHTTPYVIQEFINAREFTIVTVLLQNGEFKPLAIKYVGTENHHECIKTGKPIVSVIDEFYKLNNSTFPKIYEFTKKVIETFKPRPPHILNIQGFQIGDRYLLSELAYRPGAERINTTLYATTGYNHYTALILSHLDPNYVPRPDPEWKARILTGFWYPFREGILASHNDLPKKPQIHGTVEAEWYISPGKRLQDAKSILDMTVGLTLESATEEERDADIKWISENWAPHMVQ
ncbi:hypothetical protein QR680_004732 [Steinernema hermaphroditum]|uniref:ATP-grasp domain-containing protein n=1 Tax=Steinernema hermaphroditum TaxID=289476 RepID=A0AA39HPM6_9BILA|nr:hypothetical protein QR680_004732 [Steinernema hermaphroditum]